MYQGRVETIKRLQAVIFDMDGVLCTTDEYHYQSWKKVVRDYHIPFTRKDNEKLLGLTRQRSLEVLLGTRQLTDLEKQEILRRKNAYFLELIQNMGPKDMLSGVAELLEELSEAGLRIGVASASRNAQVVLERIQIQDVIHTITDGNTITRSKPAPDVYLKTAKTLGVNPQGCIAIEDSQAGVEAARSAGMFVVGLGPKGRVGQAHAVFPNLAGVRLSHLRNLHAEWISSGQMEDKKPAQSSVTGEERPGELPYSR